MRVCKHTGGALPPYLYNDPKGRPEIYRYKRVDGTFAPLECAYEEAVAVATKANRTRENLPALRRSLTHWADQYIEHREAADPDLKNKIAWRDRSRMVRVFAELHEHISSDRISIELLEPYWQAFSYDGQHGRRFIFSQYFVFMMGRGAANCNPFHNSETAPHLLHKKKGKKKRLPLELADFWLVYDAKTTPDFVRNAMAISIVTTMREGDIVKLRFDHHVTDDRLCVTIGKSEKQRGAARAAHLAWELDDHEVLKKAINKAREASLSLKRCPFIVATKYRRIRPHKRAHDYKVEADYLSHAFTKAVRDCGLAARTPAGRTSPSFHEIRGLAINELLKAGTETGIVQHLAAHTDESITLAYVANHEPEYQTVGVVSPVAFGDRI